MSDLPLNPQTDLREGGVHTIEDLFGPAGSLEALLNPGQWQQPAQVSVLLCHPHPLFGGTLHNKVVYHAMKVFTDLGLPVLRFNFRGVGRSAGVHDSGIGEQQDTRAGLAWLKARYNLPVLCTGFSFGAHMALRAGCVERTVAGLVSLGTPLQVHERLYSYDFLQSCEKPKLFMSGDLDEFASAEGMLRATAGAAGPNKLVWIQEADHFFKGKLRQMQESLRAWTEEFLLSMREAPSESRP